MPQSNVPNAIAMLDDIQWKLKNALRCAVDSPRFDLAVINYITGAIEQVSRVQASDCFKAPLSDGHPESLYGLAKELQGESGAGPSFDGWPHNR